MDPVGRSQAGGSQAALIRVGDAGCGSRKGCSTDAACVTEEYEEEIKRSAQNQQGWNLRPVPAGLQLQDCALLQRATTVPWEKRGKKEEKKTECVGQEGLKTHFRVSKTEFVAVFLPTPRSWEGLVLV